jgi:hypothetical protein
MLGLPVVYVTQPSAAAVYMALRAGDCDVAVSGLEMCV